MEFKTNINELTMFRFTIFIVLFFLHFSVGAEMLPVEAFGRLPHAEQLKLSPNGNQVAYIRNESGYTLIGVKDLVTRDSTFLIKTDNKKFKINRTWGQIWKLERASGIIGTTMARPIRIEYDGALYHLTSRGNGGQDIFIDDNDRLAFLDILRRARNRNNCVVYAYCLMSNHYHLLVETPDGNVSSFMRYLNSVYTQRFNIAHGRKGHVMQGRYKSILVQKDLYLLELCRYIVLNPVRARMVKNATNWPWSSYRSTAGINAPNSWVNSDWILSQFSKERAIAIKNYRQFVTQGKNQPKPWEYLKNQVFLGEDEFVTQAQAKSNDYSLEEIPAGQKRAPKKTLKYYQETESSRNEAIIKAYAGGGYTMKEIGKYFGLCYSSIGKIVNSESKFQI